MSLYFITVSATKLWDSVFFFLTTQLHDPHVFSEPLVQFFSHSLSHTFLSKSNTNFIKNNFFFFFFLNSGCCPSCSSCSAQRISCSVCHAAHQKLRISRNAEACDWKVAPPMDGSALHHYREGAPYDRQQQNR